eukprot:jgi/Mesvir1/798/Mv17391-RA.2
MATVCGRSASLSASAFRGFSRAVASSKGARNTTCLARAGRVVPASCRGFPQNGSAFLGQSLSTAANMETKGQRDLSVRAAASVLGLTKTAASAELPVVSLSPASGEEWKGDLLVLGAFVEDLELAGTDASASFKDSQLAKLDAAMGGILSELVREAELSAASSSAGKSANARIAKAGAKRVTIVSLGKHSAGAAAAWKTFGATAGAEAKTHKAKDMAIAVVGAHALVNADASTAASLVVTGAILGGHEDNRFKSEAKPPVLKAVHLLAPFGGAAPETIPNVMGVARGILLCRELVNAPPNVLNPVTLAEYAQAIAQEHSDCMSIKVLEKAECEALGMGSYLGVAAASDIPPKFIHITYTPPQGHNGKKIAIIGKGLTFDSGGYNIKTGPGCMIELMKFDMGGAAATLGAAKALGSLKLPGPQVHFIVAACENMINGSGMRPGDILTASNGKTIEVNNTDAEGRLTLADALVYAANAGAEAAVDLATLTGACIIALGNDIAGLFTPDDAMADQLSAASKAACEKIWRMPMEDRWVAVVRCIYA